MSSMSAHNPTDLVAARPLADDERNALGKMKAAANEIRHL
jgi:hypothetical protein